MSGTRSAPLAASTTRRGEEEGPAPEPYQSCAVRAASSGPRAAQRAAGQASRASGSTTRDWQRGLPSGAVLTGPTQHSRTTTRACAQWKAPN